MGDTEVRGEWDSELRQMLASLPSELERFLPEVRKAREAFYRELAAALEPRLNEHLRSLPQHSYEKKCEIASWVNRLCRETGVSLVCGESGLRGRLVASYRSDSEKESRFHLQVVGCDGRPRRVFTADRLPELHLRQAAPREEGRARPNGDSAGRTR